MHTVAPTIAITVLLRAVWISNAADLIVVMTRGGPADSTQILASYIFTQAFQVLDFGYASAIAVALLVILLGLAYPELMLALTTLAYAASGPLGGLVRHFASNRQKPPPAAA